jgi:hypothetical protein
MGDLLAPRLPAHLRSPFISSEEEIRHMVETLRGVLRKVD